MTAFEYVTSAGQLTEVAQCWQSATVVSIDTEFIRDKSYYPALCLFQLAVDDKIFVIDLVSINRPPEIRSLLTDSAITKVIHACGEDVDALYHHFHALPDNLFDTQMAAAMLGIDPQVGYSALAEYFFQVKVPKDASRTDWLARPLSDEQLEYAATDVRYLTGIYRKLDVMLKEKQLSTFFKEDSNAIVERQRYHPVPESRYLKVKQANKLNRRQLGVLQELAAWRELKAREQNLPRGFIIKDEILLEIAQKAPKTQARLAAINGLHGSDIRRFGERLIQCVNLGAEKTAAQWPDKLVGVNQIKHFKQIFGDLKQAVDDVARRHCVASYYLANRKFIESYMLQHQGLVSSSSSQWYGWRKGLLAEAFDGIMSHHVGPARHNNA